jgi:hypothetical protein
MIASSRRRGRRWPLFAGLALVCISAIVGAGFMRSRALHSKVDDQVNRAKAFVDDTVAPAVRGADLSQPLSPTSSASLDQRFSKGALSGGAVVRVRLFAIDGKLIYSTDGSDPIGSGKVGDANDIRSAAVGSATGVVDDDRVSTEEGSQSIHMLQAYLPLAPTGGGTSLAVVEVDQRMRPLEEAAQRPWRTVQLAAGGAAILFGAIALVLFGRATAAKRLAARSGFAAAPAQGSRQTEKGPAPSATSATSTIATSAKSEKDAQVRQALEDQLETLRTQLKRQEEQSTNAARQFSAQLEEATRRSREPRGASDDATRTVDERIRAAEDRSQELERQAKAAASRAEGAEARVAQLESELDRVPTEAPASATGEGGPEALRAEYEALRSRHQALRGENESLRAELEATRTRHEAARADQEAMATRIGELERRSTDTAALTEAQAERAQAAEAEVVELESRVAAAEKQTAEHRNRADAAEAVRLELETKVAGLGSRAQEAEQRAAALEEKVREASDLVRQENERVREAQNAGDVVRRELVALTAEREAVARERDRYAEELEQMELRLRRAYADAENIRPNEDAAARSATGGEEVGLDAEQDDTSLRFRLARSAARKKGIAADGDVNDDDMWS